MFVTGHTSAGFLISHLSGLSVDASIMMGVCSNISDILPPVIDGRDIWDKLYKVLHHPDKSCVSYLWALYTIFILLPFLGLHWIFDKLTHKKEGGINKFYWVLDSIFFIGNLIYCYYTFWR